MQSLKAHAVCTSCMWCVSPLVCLSKTSQSPAPFASTQVAALQGELLAAHQQRRQLEAAAVQRQREWEAALSEERQTVAALQTQVRMWLLANGSADVHRSRLVWLGI